MDATEAWNYVVGYFCSGIDYSFRPPNCQSVYPFNVKDLLELMVNGCEVVKDTRINGETGEVEEYYRGPRAGEVGQKAQLRRVGKWWIEQHLLGLRTLYYRSKHDCVARVGYHSYDKARRRFPWAERFGITSTVQKFPDVGWMLLGFDLDAKHGEPDVAALRDWLLELFPGSFWEKSTGGSGVHLYVKLAYRVAHAGNLYSTISLIDRYVAKLSAQLESRRVAKGIEAKLDQIRSTPTMFSWCERRKRVVVAKRANCIKAPRCSRGLDDLFDFHMAPFILFDGLVGIVEGFDEEDRHLAAQCPSDAHLRVQEAYEMISEASEKGKEEVTTPPATSTTTTDHPPKGTGDLVKKLKGIANTLTRKISFVYWQRRTTGHWDSIQSYVDTYIRLGVSNDGIEDDKLHTDMEAVVRHCKNNYLDQQDGTGKAEFENERTSLMKEVNTLLSVQTLTWKKEKNRVRRIDPAYVAAVLFVIRRECRLRKGQVSQSQIQERVFALIGKKPHLDLIQSITNWLKKEKLIVKVSMPVWGCGKHNRGTGYNAKFTKTQQAA